MKKLILGTPGSGKTRYLYSQIEKYMLEGKNGLVIGKEFFYNQFLEILQEKHGSHIFHREGLGKVFLLTLYSLSFEELIGHINRVKKELNLDYVVIEGVVLNKDARLRIKQLDDEDVDFILVDTVGRNAFKEGNLINYHPVLDSVVNQVDSVTWIEIKDDMVFVREGKVENGNLIGFTNEKIYGYDVLRFFEF